MLTAGQTDLFKPTDKIQPDIDYVDDFLDHPDGWGGGSSLYARPVTRAKIGRTSPGGTGSTARSTSESGSMEGVGRS